MPKTTPTKQKTNNSSSSGRPISSRTRKAARDLLTINNSSSTTLRSSSSTTRTNSSATTRTNSSATTRTGSSATTRTGSSATTPSSNSSSNATIHFIPIKKSKKSIINDQKLYSRRLHYISCSSWLTVDTFLEPLQPNKKSKLTVKVGDKYHIMNPLSGFSEVMVERISPDGKMCAISRINLNKIHEFRNSKSIEFLQMQFEFDKGKGKVPVSALKNQLFCRKKMTVTKLHTTSGYVSPPLGFKKMS